MFPATRLPMTAEIALGADLTAAPSTWSWTDISQYVRFRQGVTITAGRSDESGQVQPSTCGLTLDNTGGRFCAKNPLSPYYGQLAKNTPLRVSVTQDDLLDTFTRTTSNGWGTADTGQAWGMSGGAASDYATDGSVGSHLLTSVNVARTSNLNLGSTDCDYQVDCRFGVGAALGGPITLWALGRLTDLSNYYQASISLNPVGTTTVQAFKRVAGVGSSISSSVTCSGVNGATTWWRIRLQIIGTRLRAKAWRPFDDPSEPDWMIDVIDTSLTSGTQIALVSREETGNSNGTIATRWDNLQRPKVQRFSGFVAEWPPRWDLSQKNATAPIVAAGIMRRLTQGTPPSLSPLRRSILAVTSPTLRAYWPLEDAVESTSAASALPAGPPMTLTNKLEFAYTVPTLPPFDGSIRYGSGPQPRINAGGTLIGSVSPPSSAASWTVTFAIQYDPFPAGSDVVVLEWWTPGGTYDRYRAIWRSATTGMDLVAYNAATPGGTVLCNDGGGTWIFYSECRIEAQQSGGNVLVRMYSNNGGSPGSGSYAGTLTGVTQVAVNPTGATPTDDLIMGQVMVWDANSSPRWQTFTLDASGRIVGAWPAYLREAASRRITRLCGEDDVPLIMETAPESTVTPMGTQADGSLLDLLRACEAADLGVLSEQSFGLRYLPRGGRYNPPVTLALDKAQGHLAASPEPVDDDQRLRNTVRVTRSGGSSAVSRDLASTTANGPYVDESEVGLYTDDQLPDQAGWRLHLGLVDEQRWPSLTWNLAASPELITAWQACQVGSRLTVDNPPVEATYDQVDALLEGWTEFLGPFTWLVDAHTSPMRAWQVFEVGHDLLGRVDTDGSTLASPATTTATSLSVASTKRLWTTNAASWPFDVNIGGERVRVTVVSGTSSPQTLTVTRSINGVVKAQASGTAVSLWRPGVISL